jgi:hypothetical protein
MPLPAKLRSWNQEVMKHFNAAKAAGKPIKLRDAMKMAKKTYKKSSTAPKAAKRTRRHKKRSTH